MAQRLPCAPSEEVRGGEQNRCRPGRTSGAAGDDLLLTPPTNLRCTLVGRAAVERLGGMPTSGPGADDAGRTTLVRVRWVSPHVVGTCGVDGSGGLFYVPTAAGRKNITSMLITPALGYHTLLQLS